MSVVPIVPPLDVDLLEQHRVERMDAASRLAELPPSVDAVFRWWSRRRLIESLANLYLDDRPLLVPPRRRHLHDRFVGRLAGCAAAVRHLDARIEMVRRGHLAHVVAPETPFVLNALAESHDPDRSETNPGLPRLTESRFDETQTDFVPPPGSQCEALTHAAVEVANLERVPLIVRAGWLCSTMLAVHPFVDGNGRTSRLLFQLLASSDDELGFDWGALEQWAMLRVPYIDALKASQAPSVPDYDGRLVDTAPFIEFGIRTSIEGARIARQRADWFEAAWDRLGTPTTADAPPAATIELAVASAWSASLDELDDVLDGPASTPTVNHLVHRGRLVWDNRGLLRLADDHPLVSAR